jgi:hypothetical protein
MRAPDRAAVFPRLSHCGYEVTSAQTRAYNCVAWAAGDTTRCWWPVYRSRYFWPVEPREDRIEGFLEAFANLGFHPCPNGEYDAETEKLALFADSHGFPTHMARQLASGEWTSKCGDLEDITHTLDAFEGSDYGSVVCFLARPREAQR